MGTGQYFGAGEEVDVALRLSLIGKKLYYTPEVKVHHTCFDTGEHSLIRVRTYSRGIGALYAKLNLSKKTKLRGLFSPIIKLFFPPFIMRTKFNQTLGRFEGLNKWNELYGSGRKSWFNHTDYQLFHIEKSN